VGFLSSKLGRKKMILAGVVILCASFFFASFLSAESPAMVKGVLMPLLFALAGIGWATINVNSYPMVVELAKGGNVGKYTGFYYTASMAAQVVTPVLSGALMDVNMHTLFPYAAVFVALAFVTMFFVRHGDTKPDAAQVALDAAGGGDD
jgi:MFS family permease